MLSILDFLTWDRPFGFLVGEGLFFQQLKLDFLSDKVKAFVLQFYNCFRPYTCLQIRVRTRKVFFSYFST